MSETSAANELQNCPYCGALHHGVVCHLVKAIEYHPNGAVKRVEFKGAPDFNTWVVPYQMAGPDGRKTT